MKDKLTPLFEQLADRPARVWLYGIIPLFAAMLLLCLFSGKCSILTPDQTGYRLFKEGRYKAAAQTFIDPQWKAVTHYRNGDFKEAVAILGGYDNPEAAFNQGNSLLMLGKYEQAVQRYERALDLKPGWRAAEENLQIAAIRAERMKKEGGEMTGGQLEADEIVFTRGKSSDNSGEEVIEEQSRLSDAEMRAVWLRNVQTRPADFLRSKFAYQQAVTPQGGSLENKRTDRGGED